MAKRTCALADCDSPSRSLGLCLKHYTRVYRYGTTERVKRRPTCKIDGCGKLNYSQGWCKKHHARWQRHGDPMAVYPGARYPSRRYRRVKRPGHPLARKDGAVALHRYVLYEAIGPGAHPCHWCDRLVEWEKSYPQDPDALVVDHLDWNRANNELGNLAPSCPTCNTGRQAAA